MKRFDYLDIAKGIGILTVVWAHIMLVGASHRLIYAFHMPLFFFISGLLFNKDKYDSLGAFLKQRFKRLFIPYVVYSLVSWAVWAGFRYLRGDEVDSFFAPLLQIVLAQGSGEFIVYNSVLWFVPCLFAVEIMYYAFSRFNERISLSLCFIVAGIGALLVWKFGKDYLFLLPWNLDAAFFALPFYGVANAIRRHLSHEKLMTIVGDNKLLTLVGIVMLFGTMYFFALNFGECSMGSSSYGCPIWIFFVRAFSGCFGLVLLSAVICTQFTKGWWYDSLRWCGKNSLDVMCLHIPIKGVVMILIAKALHLSFDISENLMYSTIAFIITTVILVPIVLMIKLMINKYIRKN